MGTLGNAGRLFMEALNKQVNLECSLKKLEMAPYRYASRRHLRGSSL